VLSCERLERRSAWLDRVLACTVLVTLVLGGRNLGAWYGQRVEEQQVQSLLLGIRKRQMDYDRMNQAYAGSLETLRIVVPKDLEGRLTLLAGRFGGVPDFFVEFCRASGCRAIDARGVTRRAVHYVPRAWPTRLPVLEEGQGRFFLTRTGENAGEG